MNKMTYKIITGTTKGYKFNTTYALIMAQYFKELKDKESINK